MKKIVYIIFALILLGKTTNGQSVDVSIAGWGVATNNLLDGKIKYESNSGETPFNTVLTFGRLNGSTQVRAQAIYIFEGNGLEIPISDSIIVNTADFTQNTGVYWSKEFVKTAKLQPNNKNGIVKLKWRFFNNYSGGTNQWSPYYYAAKTYQTVMYNGNNPTIPPYDPRAVSIYIYNSKIYSDHYLTPVNNPSIGGGSYLNEGIAFYAYTSQIGESVPIYVYNSKVYGDHFYFAENQPSIGADGSYINEGIAFYAFKTQVAGSVPLYVYNSKKHGDHYWTTLNSPRIGEDASYENEGVIFYVYPVR